jgi:hypothetical protein
MWKHFSLQGNYQWVNGLQSLVDRYNDNVHSSTGFKPYAVTLVDEYMNMRRLFSTCLPSVVRKP